MSGKKWIVFIAVILVWLILPAAYSENSNILFLPESLTSIEEEAFYQASSFEELVVPEGVTNIGARAFAHSSLSRINLPEGVAYIAPDAFEGCDNLVAEVLSESFAHRYCLEHGIAFDLVSNKVSADDFLYYKSGYPDADGETIWTEAYIYGYNGTAYDVVIPNYIDGLRVMSIEYGAFENNRRIRTVVIPEGVTSIEDNAFSGCVKLESIAFPKKLETIGSSAFEGCTRLDSVVIPEAKFDYIENDYSNGNLSIGNSAFKNCDSLQTLTIHRSMNFGSHNSVSPPSIYLGASSFEGCEKLSNVCLTYEGTGYWSFSGSIHLGAAAFKDCDMLETVSLNGGFYDIGESVFENCVSLKYLDSSDIFSVGESAFRNCISIEEIPNGIYTVGDFAFEGCSSLKKIKLFSGNIGESAFAGCSNLTTVDFGNSFSTGDSYDNNVIGRNAFSGCLNLTVLSLNVSEIDENAFSGCSALKHVLITNTQTSIAENAFEGCNPKVTIYKDNPAEEYLKANDILYDVINDQFWVSILDSERCSVDHYYGNSSDIVIPERFGPYTVTALGSSLFEDDVINNINSLTLPNGITEIGWRALTTSPNSMHLCFNANTPTFEAMYTYCEKYEFGFDEYILFYSPSYPEYQIEYNLDTGVPRVGIVGYEGSSSTVTIPNNIDGLKIDFVNTWGGTIWEGTEKLIIEPGIELRGGYRFQEVGTFSECTSLVDVVFMGDAPYITYYCFANCPNLQTVSFKGKVGEIAVRAFAECRALESVFFKDDVGSIGEYAFYNDNSLKTVMFSGTAESIGSSAFYYCRNLSKLALPKGNPVIGRNAFYQADLAMITIPDGWTEIADDAFYGNSLQKVWIPDSVTFIGNDALGYISSRPNSPVIYCNAYSYAQTWANQKNLPVELMDGKTFADYGSIAMPEFIRIPVGSSIQTDWNMFPYDPALVCQWSSSDQNIASVDSEGRISALAQGEIVITVSAGDISAQMVVETYMPITSFILSMEEATIKAGTSIHLSVLETVPAGSNAQFVWESENELMATVDANGLVSALSVGDVVINCVSENGLSRSCIIHVVRP